MKRLLTVPAIVLAILAGLTPSLAGAQTDAASPTPQTMVRGSFADGPSGPVGVNVLSLFEQLAEDRLATPQGSNVALAGALDTLGAVGQSNAAAGCTGTTGSAASTGCATFQAGSGFAAAAVPEPGMLMLIGSSLLALSAVRARRAAKR